ncbi:MAG: DNA-dependent RNA polymerase auxiliary subunit epsilon family protein [Lactobacillales bacterium]|jgi:DNA-dependent RNA polymerase auxiliary subunit epsilon|nr:DNA-dependent RNA polymerase auxiliary subunit epsilon family protein [Lactobacillales bacterium]
MLLKVYYQEEGVRSPRREKTRSLYIEAESKVDVIEKLEKYTHYNIEYIVVLEGKFLDYEKEYTNFELSEY